MKIIENQRNPLEINDIPGAVIKKKEKLHDRIMHLCMIRSWLDGAMRSSLAYFGAGYILAESNWSFQPKHPVAGLILVEQHRRREDMLIRRVINVLKCTSAQIKVK